MSKELMVLDLVIGWLNAAARGQQLLQQARAEGRTVTDEEYDALVEETQAIIDEWNNAGGN